MRASAIWVWRMVLVEEMSSGRTMPADRQAGAARRWSAPPALPWITILPLGRMPVNDHRRHRQADLLRARLIEPSPAVGRVLDVGGPPRGRGRTRRAGFSAQAAFQAEEVGGCPADTEPELRDAWPRCWPSRRLSSMAICTVRMSPTRAARWSMKKARPHWPATASWRWPGPAARASSIWAMGIRFDTRGDQRRRIAHRGQRLGPMHVGLLHRAEQAASGTRDDQGEQGDERYAWRVFL
jgi:hypothetical protein